MSTESKLIHHSGKLSAQHQHRSDVNLLRDAFNSVCDYRTTLAQQSLSVWKKQCKIGESKRIVDRKIESIDKHMGANNSFGQDSSNERISKSVERNKRTLHDQKMALWEQQRNLHEEREEIDERRRVIERQMNELHEHMQDMGEYRRIKF